jgi:inosine/xanthosine triphosphatase
MKIVVASKNPVKIEAVKIAFTKMFPGEIVEIEGVDVPSDVPDQPWGDAQTELGARNRVMHAQRALPGASYYVANESGVKEHGPDIFITNWVVVSDGQEVSSAHTASFVIPPAVAKHLRQGMELGPAFEAFFGPVASKQGAGGVGKLTHGLIPRTELLVPAIITAAIPFTNRDLYLNTAQAA